MLATSREHQPIILLAPSTTALKPLDELNREGRGDHRVLAGRLLASPPPGVPENVDVRSPEGQPALTHIVHRPRLRRDGRPDGGPERAVEGRRHEEDLGEGRGGPDDAGEGDAGAVGGDPVEGLGPPLVGGDAEPRDRGGIVGELLDLLPEGEVGDEGASPVGDGEGGVAERVGVEAGRLAGELRVPS